MSFENFGFHPEIMAGIDASKYVAPTPIQAQAIPPVLAGRDVLGLADVEAASGQYDKAIARYNAVHGQQFRVVVNPGRDLRPEFEGVGLCAGESGASQQDCNSSTRAKGAARTKRAMNIIAPHSVLRVLVKSQPKHA